MIQDGKGHSPRTDKHSLVFPGFLPRGPSGYVLCLFVTVCVQQKIGLRAYARLYYS